MMGLRRCRRMVLVLSMGALVTGAREAAEAPAPPPASQQEITVIGVFSDAHGQHGVLLEGKRDRRRFVMVIGAAEATAIAVPLENITPPRPLTHDLFLTLFGRLQVSVTKVVINDLRQNTYYATVHLAAAGAPLELDSRPSDAIALAIRAKVPVFAEERVFQKSGRIPDAQGERI